MKPTKKRGRPPKKSTQLLVKSDFEKYLLIYEIDGEKESKVFDTLDSVKNELIETEQECDLDMDSIQIFKIVNEYEFELSAKITKKLIINN